MPVIRKYQKAGNEEQAPVTRERQKAEAIKRMKILKLLPQLVKEFEKQDTIYYSERVSADLSVLYWVENKPEWVEIVKEFEKKWDAVVYHAELSHTELGDMLSLLYVSAQEEEWERDKENLSEEGYCIAYVKNLDDDFCSELGGITVKPFIGGIRRTG